jgi:hypothetical protein
VSSVVCHITANNPFFVESFQDFGEQATILCTYDIPFCRALHIISQSFAIGLIVSAVIDVVH